jgi:hypothetical protein
VAGLFGVPAVEHRLGRAVGLVVAVLVGDEEEVRRGAGVDPAEAHFEAGEVHEVVLEDGALVEPAVAVDVFEDDDAIFSGGLWIGVVVPAGIGQALGHPHAPAVIEREGDRLNDVRLGREDRGGEAGRQRHLRRRLLRRKRLRRGGWIGVSRP